MIRILLADDHQIVRDGMKLIIESRNDFEVTGEVSNGLELLNVVFDVQPDLIVSDLKMPGPSIIESCKVIKEKLPKTKIIILTAYDQSEDIYLAISQGIDGYIMKDTPPSEILKTLEMVSLGYSCFQPKVNMLKEETNTQVFLNLTEREQEIFQCIFENLSNSEIAERMFISEATVKTHVSSILRKTGQPNRSQAVLYAIQHGHNLVKL
ncbi:response regulator [Peribacillus alkalitolerans]|uniref:response regulator n=1 Tax=Peribacillus alkalitolerans TaxID=1550385 RepID=UPI0013D735E0|nr:response regulator transcription factor [Peribacillus alkalitolerans]